MRDRAFSFLRRFCLNPVAITFLFHLIVVASVIIQAGGDPLALARMGTRYSQGMDGGTEGYDGQFVYYIARDPNPQEVSKHLDVPPYRYQRILLPLLARCLSFGSLSVLPWTLVLLGLITQTIGTWVVAQLLSSWGVNPWYALVYGLWAGFTLAVRLDLPEPLAYGLVAGSLLAHERGKSWMSCVLLGLSVFAKEVTMLFVLAAILASIASKRWRDGWCMALITVLPYALFQVWLWRIFGEPGIGSGGAMATSFEIIPLKGFLQIGAYSLVYLLAMLVVFGPSILLPAIWGVWAGLRRWVAGDPTHIVFALLLNAIIIFFLPFSTVRETGGLLRFASGLVLSVLLFAARYRYKKVLNYSALWLVMNTFLLKS